jgi:hypothetical protein
MFIPILGKYLGLIYILLAKPGKGEQEIYEE